MRGAAVHAAPQTGSIAAGTALGTVRLAVSDLEMSRAFYRGALGMSVTERADDALALGADVNGRSLLELRGSASGPAGHSSTGLYHVAILVPSRRDLACALVRLARARWPLQGASDHLVSEALYLADPDGNGIEIYCDRPRTDWPRDGGALRMATLPLDLDDLLAEVADDGASNGRARAAVDAAMLPAGTTVGHIHLQVADLGASEAFYSGVLGFDITVRGYPGALFASAGGYHHHIGMNTWQGAGASPAPAGSAGLRSFEVVLPDASALEQTVARVRAAGLPSDQVDGGMLVRDPSANGILLTA